ncbi:hydroxymethylglutaryl-CoA lyase [Alcaligenaceae bacterium A4P071]|nr:hydroxymethylglutaryl-CoA lyase [Alcaligenaceae bacterium C4P045]MDQ2185139.1 hydroxymethylglutaryl-CoA lyase [Alcaligenaceae bacterium A4P071]
MSIAYPRHVVLTEVGMRDGLQMEHAFVPTETKIAMINDLIATGLTHLEVTSFVSPKAVPQLRDAAEVLAGVDRRAEVTLSVLAPNVKGIERALAARADGVVVFLSASESHNQKNLNRSIERSLGDMRDAAAATRGSGVQVQGAIAVAFGCPFEGDVPVERVLEIAHRFASLGFDGITLGDTTGMATPPVVRRTVEALRAELPDMPLTLHFHNTRGLGLVNVMEGLQLGIDAFESSLGGIGGCPFAPGATGNICTEDTVHLLHALGIDTGVNLDALLGVAARLETVLARPLPGQVLRSGPRLRRYGLEEQAAAVG